MNTEGGDIVYVLFLIGGLALPFFPVAACVYLCLLVAAIFVPASWFGL
jgi:hypothetical protein